jgi:hypothetical protein
VEPGEFCVGTEILQTAAAEVTLPAGGVEPRDANPFADDEASSSLSNIRYLPDDLVAGDEGEPWQI